MPSQRTLFLKHLAQTSPSPLLLEIQKAEGLNLFDTSGKRYMDMISGIAVSSVGHRHPHVLQAIQTQLDKHLHVMVYGELMQSTQTHLAEKISSLSGFHDGQVFFVNSGSEAIEGALKLAKKFTGRTEIISFLDSYHGSSHGALSVGGSEIMKSPFRPLLPDIRMLAFNSVQSLSQISERTACVVVEPIQAEAGVRLPAPDFLNLLRKRCDETGTLLILDEIQTGIGRTGTWFAFEQFGIRPDILCLGKALGAGMPLGAFISSQKIMSCLSENPALSHITTFGGHPVSCAAALAGIEVCEKEQLLTSVASKASLIESLLTHSAVKEIRKAGLLIALEFESESQNMNIIAECISQGAFTDWFLFNSRSMRLAPPLTITNDEISEACGIIRKAIIKFS